MRTFAWIGQRAGVTSLLASHCSKSPFIRSSTRLISPPRPISPLVLKCSWSKKPSKMDFRVATYNVLCSHLAEPSHFPQCSPKHLDAATRLRRVKHKLEPEISKGSVICLQEVGVEWAGDLHVFFMAKGYTFITALYGKHFNNYMGVALAWPVDKYECLTVDITRLSETRRWGREPRVNREDKDATTAAATPAAAPATATEQAGWGGPLGALMKLAGRGIKRPREEADRGEAVVVQVPPREAVNPWQIAERRFNQVLFARLRPKNASSASDVTSGGTFCVGTYHMPCLFNIRPVMVMHTSLAIKHVAKLAGSDPFVLAGDFNFNPDSECYKLAVEGDLPASSDGYPVVPEWEKDWSPKTGVSLESAYRQVDGKEPDFTNNAKVEDWDPFIDTLDYIFHTPGVTATKVLPLKHRSEVKGPFPIAEEPSDHVLLAAEYSIDPPSGGGGGGVSNGSGGDRA